MDKTLLKKDTVFYNEDIVLYMYEIITHSAEDTVKAVTSAYPVLDYTVKGNFIYVTLPKASVNESMFDLEIAYKYCINTFINSEPYFETEIGHMNTIVDKDVFVVLPMGTDVFDLIPKTVDAFKEKVLDHIEYFMNQRDEKLFDNLLKKLYYDKKIIE